MTTETTHTGALELLRAVSLGRRVGLSWLHNRANPLKEPVGGMLIPWGTQARNFVLEEREIDGVPGYAWWTARPDELEMPPISPTQSVDEATARTAIARWIDAVLDDADKPQE